MTIWVLFFSQTYSVFQESKLALVQEMTSTCRRKVESRFLNQWWTRPMTQIYSICNCSDVSSTEAKRHVFVLKVSVNIGSRNDLLLFAAKPFLFYNRWWLHIIKNWMIHISQIVGFFWQFHTNQLHLNWKVICIFQPIFCLQCISTL